MLTLNKFFEIIDSLEEARVLLAALEFRIFSILEKKKLTAKQVAQKSKTKLEGMEALLLALVALKALKYERGRFFNTAEGYKYLCESSPDFKKGSVFLKQEKNDEWAQLIKTIKHGRDLSGFEGGDDPNFRYFFSHAMHERSLPYASEVADLLAKKPIGRFLDLGGGPGSYCAAVLKKDKKAEATLLDRASACKVARELHGDKSFFKRFHLKRGDLFDTEYGNGFDTIFFSNILHIYDPVENMILLNKMNQALVPGGRLALVDYFLKEDRTQPYEAALFSLTMLLFTETGKTYSFKETEALLKKTGFHQFRTHKLDSGTSMIVAHKK